MNTADYIKLFESSIKKYMKRAKLRQLYLASLLDVTPSAVSQMLKCRLVMSRAQLYTICEGLKLSSDEALELQTLLSRIRDGESAIKTPFNRFMITSRRQHKLSMQRLSQMTKISIVRLRAFEKDVNVEFTGEDAEKISKIYGCTPEFLRQKLSFGPCSVEYTPPVTGDNALIEVADRGGTYDTRQKISVVRLKDFAEFSENANLFTFANIRSCDEMLYELGRDGVAVIADGRDIGLSVPGEVILFVTDKKPLSYVCRLVLCMDSSRKYRLLQKLESNDKFYEVAPDNTLVEFTGKLRWALAVIELKFTPKMLI